MSTGTGLDDHSAGPICGKPIAEKHGRSLLASIARKQPLSHPSLVRRSATYKCPQTRRRLVA
jgi:hypothetical protein